MMSDCSRGEDIRRRNVREPTFLSCLDNELTLAAPTPVVPCATRASEACSPLGPHSHLTQAVQDGRLDERDNAGQANKLLTGRSIRTSVLARCRTLSQRA